MTEEHMKVGLMARAVESVAVKLISKERIL